jgi:hypothetical protein
MTKLENAQERRDLVNAMDMARNVALNVVVGNVENIPEVPVEVSRQVVAEGFLRRAPT